MRVASISEGLDPHNSSDVSNGKSKRREAHRSQFHQLFDAIVDNDVIRLRNLVTSLKDEERNSFLTSSFGFDDDDDACAKFFRKSRYTPTRPLHVAVYADARDVISAMISLGFDVTVCDELGFNILHTLVAFNYYNPEEATNAVAMFDFLQRTLPAEMMRQLLMAENDDGLRMVEFAAQQGTLRLLHAIMTSCDTYVIERRTVGLNVYTMIDVTEYESGSRYDKSPLLMIAHLHRDKLDHEETREIVRSDVMRSWVRAKMKTNVIPILLWAIVRVTILTTHLAADYDSTSRVHYLEMKNMSAEEQLCSSFYGMNYTPTGHLFLQYFNLITSCLVVLFDICEITYLVASGKHRMWRDLGGIKRLVVNVKFYRTCEFVTMLLSIFIIGVAIQTHENLHNTDVAFVSFVYFIRVLLPVFIVWSVFYFIQVLPWIGDSIISIQGMVKDMFRFVILMAIFNLPFMHLFYIGLSNESLQGCIEDFRSVPMAFYSLFRLSLNMVDPTNYEIEHEASFYFMHAVFVYVVGIVLLNFLIAVMANVQAFLEANRSVLMTLNTLSVACYAELRMRSILAPIYRRVRPNAYFVNVQGKICVIFQSKRQAKDAST